MGKLEGKIATGPTRSNMAAAVHFVVNRAEKERKMAREDKYYSEIALFIKYKGILCHYWRLSR